KGEARLSRIAPGRYQIHVEAVGFKARDIDDQDLHSGSNRTEVTLEIDPIKVDVEVSEEQRVRNSDPNGPTFTNVMTAEQIAQLRVSRRSSGRSPGLCKGSRSRAAATVRPLDGWSNLEKSHVTFSQRGRIPLLRCQDNRGHASYRFISGSCLSPLATTQL